MAKTIFISGASRGFGKLWAQAFLEQGHNVVATAKDLLALDDLNESFGRQLLALKLDVTDREAAFKAVQQAKDHFGQIDILINNAGFGLLGSIEEASEAQVRAIMDTNFFWTALVNTGCPTDYEEQHHGHIIQITSILGLMTWPTLGLYNASKFAVEGLSESLAKEIKSFNIKLTMVEPGAYATDFSKSSAALTEAIPAYDEMKAAFRASMAGTALGKPEATTQAIMQIAGSENPPLRLILGSNGYQLVKTAYSERLAEWEAWQDVAHLAQGD